LTDNKEPAGAFMRGPASVSAGFEWMLHHVHQVVSPQSGLVLLLLLRYGIILPKE